MLLKMNWRRLINLKLVNYSTQTIIQNEQEERVHSLIDFEYTVETVRNSSYNIYSSLSHLPYPVFRSAIALRAFYFELAFVPNGIFRVSVENESQKYLKKLDSWKCKIEKLFLPEVKLNVYEPVCNELYLVVKNHKIKQDMLNRIIDGKKQFFYNTKTLNDLDKCAELTTSTIYLVLLKCMKITSASSVEIVSNVGKCEFITNLLRNLLKPNSDSVYYLPTELLEKHKLSQQDFINHNERNLKAKHQNIKDLTNDLATRAWMQHSHAALSINQEEKKKVSILCGPSLIDYFYLKKLAKYDFDLMNPVVKDEYTTQMILELIEAQNVLELLNSTFEKK